MIQLFAFKHVKESQTASTGGIGQAIISEQQDVLQEILSLRMGGFPSLKVPTDDVPFLVRAERITSIGRDVQRCNGRIMTFPCS